MKEGKRAKVERSEEVSNGKRCRLKKPGIKSTLRKLGKRISSETKSKRMKVKKNNERKGTKYEIKGRFNQRKDFLEKRKKKKTFPKNKKE